MNGDILPPRRPRPEAAAVPSDNRTPARHRAQSPGQPTVAELPIVSEPPVTSMPGPQPLSATKRRSYWRKRLTISLIAVIAVLVIALVGCWLWYSQQLRAVEPGSNQQVKITVPSGANSAAIADILKDKQLIRSTTAFELYVRLNGQSGSLQIGSYLLSKGSDVAEIVAHIAGGKVDTFSITFLPGNTLAKHRQGLIEAGYSQASVDRALNKNYSHPLLASKPASADLEGYIYGETYQFSAQATPEDIIKRTFDEMYKFVQQEDLAALYKKQGLTLHEGITLASIIQKEVTEKTEMAQAAQVFYLRLKKGEPLGSDPTYQYIADKMGQARDLNFDSPYNTRRYKGVPPGPISSPGAGALYAVGHPAKGDYLYFVSGDDDKTYFSRTNQEHEANVEKHCIKKCQIL